MTIFGRRWPDAADALQAKYERWPDRDPPARYLHVPRRGEPLRFRCAICRVPYRHWLCADVAWNKLPASYRRLCLCVSCYRCVRYVAARP